MPLSRKDIQNIINDTIGESVWTIIDLHQAIKTKVSNFKDVCQLIDFLKSAKQSRQFVMDTQNTRVAKLGIKIPKEPVPKEPVANLENHEDVMDSAAMIPESK